jgi:hypothetical protein
MHLTLTYVGHVGYMQEICEWLIDFLAGIRDGIFWLLKQGEAS